MDNFPASLQLIFCLLLAVEAIVLSHLIAKVAVGWILGFKLREIKLGIGNFTLSKASIFGINVIISALPLGGCALFADESSIEGHNSSGISDLLKEVCLLLSGPFGNFGAAIIILILSFALFGEINYTLQVVNIEPNSPAAKALIKRGDIVRGLNGKNITDFDKGRKLIANYPDLNVTLNIERKTNFLQFKDYKRLLDYLSYRYQPRDYIRIYETGDESRLFYAKQPALDHIEKINLNNLRVEVSTSSQFIDLKIKPDSLGRIGIGIKPYALEESITYPGCVKSINLAVSHASFVTLALAYELKIFVERLIANGSFYLGGSIVSELFQFIVDVSNLDVNLSLRYLSMICLLAGVMNLLPFPQFTGYHVGAIIGCKAINNLCKYLFSSEGDFINEDAKNYLRLLYNGAFVLLLLLIITHSFPTLSRLF